MLAFAPPLVLRTAPPTALPTSRPSPPSRRPPPSLAPLSATRLTLETPLPPSPPTPAPSVTPIVGLAPLLASIRASPLTVLYCRAAWCRTCTTLAPKVARFAAAAPQTVAFLSMDISFEENRALGKIIGAEMLPTFVFFRGAAEGGADDEEVVTAALERRFIAGAFGVDRLKKNLEEAVGEM